MAENEEDPIVVYELPDGTEVSNDPRWRARRQLKSEGVDVDAMKARIAELEAQIASGSISPQAAGNNAPIQQDAADNDEIEDSEAGEGTYADVKGAELVSLAKERGISLKHEDGSKLKAGEVRAALAADDAAKA
jgi:hypothetical protein